MITVMIATLCFSTKAFADCTVTVKMTKDYSRYYATRRLTLQTCNESHFGEKLYQSYTTIHMLGIWEMESLSESVSFSKTGVVNSVKWTRTYSYDSDSEIYTTYDTVVLTNPNPSIKYVGIYGVVPTADTSKRYLSDTLYSMAALPAVTHDTRKQQQQQLVLPPD